MIDRKYMKISANKQLFLCFLFVFTYTTACAQLAKNRQYEQYFAQYKDIAIEQMRKYKIPASITLAQGVFESGAGNSILARKGNNHFGIKCHNWDGKTMYYSDDNPNDCFRVYKNARESYEDHSVFLSTGSRYQALFRLKITDYKGWAHGLKKAGYATNPKYAYKLIDIIETYELYRYDSGKHSDKFIRNHSLHTSEFDYTIYSYNKNYYIFAKAGDTFESLSKKVGISRGSLAKYNERDKKDILQAGDIVYLKKKRSRVAKEYRKTFHTVKAGESMYSISQLYGIRMKFLYKANKLAPDYQIQTGDKLYLK